MQPIHNIPALLVFSALAHTSHAQFSDYHWRGELGLGKPDPAHWVEKNNWSPDLPISENEPTTLLVPDFPTFPLGANTRRAIIDRGFTAVGIPYSGTQGYGGEVILPFAQAERQIAGLRMIRAVRGDFGPVFATGSYRPDHFTINLNGTHLLVRPPETGAPAADVLHVSASGTDIQPISKLVIKNASIGAQLDVRDYGNLTLTNEGLIATPISVHTPSGIRGLVNSEKDGDRLAKLTLDGYSTTGLHIPFIQTGPGVGMPNDVTPAVLAIGQTGWGELNLLNNSTIGGYKINNGDAALARLVLAGDRYGLPLPHRTTGQAVANLLSSSTLEAGTLDVGERADLLLPPEDTLGKITANDQSYINIQNTTTIGFAMRGEALLSGLSRLDTANLEVGVNADTVQDPGLGDGTIKLEGSTLDVDNLARVGIFGTGRVIAGFGFYNDGSTGSNFQAPLVEIGVADGSTGLVEFQPFSSGHFTTRTQVGKAGDGTLIVGDLPYAEAPAPEGFSPVVNQYANLTLGAVAPPPGTAGLSVGSESTGNGLVRVRRGGIFTIDYPATIDFDFIRIGEFGQGVFEVQSGGAVESSGPVIVGHHSGSQGRLVVEGKDGMEYNHFTNTLTTRNSSFLVNSKLTVGRDAEGGIDLAGGTLIVRDRGLVSVQQLSVGELPDSSGRVIVGEGVADGETSVKATLGGSVIGNEGRGFVEVNAAEFTSLPDLHLGAESTGNGNLTVLNGGQTTTGHLKVSLEDSGLPGTWGQAKVTVLSGSSITCDEATIGANGEVILADNLTSTLTVTGPYHHENGAPGGRTHVDGTLTAEIVSIADGTLSGTGKVKATGPFPIGTPGVEIAAPAVLSPGASIGTLSVESMRMVIDGEMATEFSNTQSDKLVVQGTLELGATSVLRLVLDSPTDTPCGTYVIASYTAGRSGTFPTVINELGLPATVNYGPASGAGEITVTVGGPMSFPAYMALLGITTENGPLDDFDKDGLDNLLDYLFGANAAIPDAIAPFVPVLSTAPASAVGLSGTDTYLVLTVQTRNDICGVTWSARFANHLDEFGNNTDVAAIEFGTPVVAGSRTTRTFRSPVSIQSQPRGFMRVEATYAP